MSLFKPYNFSFLPVTAIAVLTLAMLAAQPAYAAQDLTEGEAAHGEIFSEDDYPSATLCAPCHARIYEEWSSSNHAYASISPMFHKFEQAINALTQGTIGDFCVRCHQGGGVNLNEPREAPLWERSRISNEGISCIICHRVEDSYTRANAERRIVPGNINQPIFGPYGGDGVASVIEKKAFYKVATSADERGNQIHTKGVKFPQLSKSEFCMSCHQVAINLGIKLEVVWEQYRASPAAAAGITCQDCHMGKTPGRADGYNTGPAAVVNGKEINPDRKSSNHAFYGPGYPIAHPGIFPHNPDAENWTVEEWLKFDYRAGWGTEEFEEAIDEEEIEVEFPEIWEDPFDREEAREVVDVNLERLEDKRRLRQEVMENGMRLDGPFFDGTPTAGQALSFYIDVINTDEGHNLPSGSLGAQPELWLNLALIDPDGENVWETGYVDALGDMADIHSLEVAAGNIEFDSQLFNLQTKFLTTNVKGTDREMYLPVSFDIDQRPMLRPAPQPTTVINHTPFVRMEARSLPPLSSRKANYTIPASVMSKTGTYTMAIRMRSRAEPIYFMRFVGATKEMEQSMNDWMLDIHPYSVEFQVY
jgi:hypothetical protein